MKRIRILTILAIFFTLPFLSKGQPGPPPAGPPPCWPPPCSIPIDGGISFLAAAGVLYAGKKLLRKNKKNPE